MFESHLGLRENPFVAGHQPRFVYPSREHQEALAHLRFGIENREPFVLITGEVGTGKTTAIYDALHGWGTRAVVALITNSALTRGELLEEIALRFGLALPPGMSKPQAMVMLERHLQAIHERGELAVLLLDEAQNLERDLLEEIRLLSNLEAGGQKLLQIFLVGQPELEQKLGSVELRQLRQRITVHYRLNPLSPEETERYIHHRVAVAGGNAHELFPHETCMTIYTLTHGIPREINTVCGQALINAYVDDCHVVMPDHVITLARDTAFKSVLDMHGLPGTASPPPVDELLAAEGAGEHAPMPNAPAPMDAPTPEPAMPTAPPPIQRPTFIRPPVFAQAPVPYSIDPEPQVIEPEPPGLDASAWPAAAPAEPEAETEIEMPLEPEYEAHAAAAPEHAASPAAPEVNPVSQPQYEPVPEPEPESEPAPTHITDVTMPSWLDEVIARNQSSQAPQEHIRPAVVSAKLPEPYPITAPPPIPEPAPEPAPRPAPVAATPISRSMPAPVRIAPDPNQPEPVRSGAQPDFISARLRQKLDAAEARKRSSAAMPWFIAAVVLAAVAVAMTLMVRFGDQMPWAKKAGAPATAATTPAETPPASEPTASAPNTPSEVQPASQTNETHHEPLSNGANPSAPATSSPAAVATPPAASEPAPPKPLAVKPAAPKPAAAKHVYGIVVGTYFDEGKALEVAGKAAGPMGMPTRTLAVIEDGAPMYRAVVGRFEDRALADLAASRLAEKGGVSEARVVVLGTTTPKK